MGLLDDAIREHLELKRRHGADPAEVERAEREALGPVRRKEPAETAAAGDDLTAGDELAYHDADSDWTDDDDRLPAEEPVAPRRLADVDEADDFGPYEEDQDADETREFLLGDEAGDAGEGAEDEEDDMLEETPEFLQDTPDHDRLWFEQRPPRDFDFDG